MKNKIIKILSKPKFVISIFAVIAVTGLVLSYNEVGKAPEINIGERENYSNSIPYESNVSLSFARGGKVKEVSVSLGQKVYKGQVLARLYAPDSEGAVAQAKGALELAEAQYMSLNSQYATTKKAQDLIVKNAYNSLLSTGLEATPDEQTSDVAVISGTYTCGKEGQYILKPYRSGDGDTGYSFEYSGLEYGVASVKYQNPVALGNCGLQIKWVETTSFDENIEWVINIPNTKSASYLTYKNAYDLAVENREKVLKDLEVNIGTPNGETSVAKAQVNAARGAWQAALGSYENNLIIAPIDGVVNFIDDSLKVGQSIQATKNVININRE